MLKLLLINPSNAHKGLGNIRSTAWPPLNLPYLAALTPDHYEIDTALEARRGIPHRACRLQRRSCVSFRASKRSRSRAYPPILVQRPLESASGVPSELAGTRGSFLQVRTGSMGEDISGSLRRTRFILRAGRKNPCPKRLISRPSANGPGRCDT